MSLFLKTSKALRRTLICCVGKRGETIYHLLNVHIPDLDVATILATRTFYFPSEKEGVEQFIAVREELTSLKNTQEIRRIFKEDHVGDQINVQHLLLGALEDLDVFIQNFSESIIAKYESDQYEVVCLVDEESDIVENNIENIAKRRLKNILQKIPKLIIVSGKNAEDSQITSASIEASMLGYVLTKLVMRESEDVPTKSVEVLGISGFYGITGETLQRLSAEYGKRIVRNHLMDLRNTKDNREVVLDPETQNLLDRYASKTIAQQLFYQSMKKTLGPDNQDLLSKAEWVDQVLKITLDRGETGLQVTLVKKESEWVDELKKHSRAIDMIVAYTWRMQIEKTAAELVRKISTDLVQDFTIFLGSKDQGPGLISIVLEKLTKEWSVPKEANTESIDDVDARLTDLNAAVKARPNMLMMISRILLWLIPLLTIIPGTIFFFYEDIRAPVFAFLALGIGIILPASWVVWTYLQSRRRIEKARRAAIDAITARQESILSENIIAYLNDSIATTVKSAMQACEEKLRQYKEVYSKVGDKLDEVVLTNRMKENSTFYPVLSEGDEYRKAIGDVKFSIEEELKKTVAQGLMDSIQMEEQSVYERILAWSRGRILEFKKEGGLTFRDLLNIRQKLGRFPSDMSLIGEVKNLSLPFIENMFAPKDPLLSVLAPDMFIEKNVWKTLNIEEENITSVDGLQFVTLMQTGSSEQLDNILTHE